MTDHPITPPLELVHQWIHECTGRYYEHHIATQAARWGADQELEACCEWFKKEGWNSCHPETLRAARRPQPPSLKEQALAVVENSAICDHLSPEHAGILRRALEQLDPRIAKVLSTPAPGDEGCDKTFTSADQ